MDERAFGKGSRTRKSRRFERPQQEKQTFFRHISQPMGLFPEEWSGWETLTKMVFREHGTSLH
jgi:hypothetical protein